MTEETDAEKVARAAREVVETLGQRIDDRIDRVFAGQRMDIDSHVGMEARMSAAIGKVHEDVLENKATVLDVREKVVDLKGHVNDEIALMHAEIASKQDSSSLLGSVGFQLLNNKAVRWALGSTAVAAFATVVSSHWVPWLEWVFQFFRLV
jgi:hypothetical protein